MAQLGVSAGSARSGKMSFVRRKAARFIGSVVRITLALSAMLVGIAMFQDHLLYFPAKARLAEMTSGRLGAWPGPEDFRGLSAEPEARARGTAIVFHGNAGHAGDRAFYAEMLNALGLRVILAEYPGYGPRDGDLGEGSLVADAEQTILRAHRLYGPPLLLVGESLGAGVAAAAAARQADKLAGLLLITPWDRLASVASHHYPWLPVSLLLRDRYDNVTNLASFRHPVAVVLAERDSIIPVRFGMALYGALTVRKRLWVVKGADHNDWVLRVNGPWWREVSEFLVGVHREAD